MAGVFLLVCFIFSGFVTSQALAVNQYALVVDQAGIFGDELSRVERAARELKSKGADVHIWTIKSFSDSGEANLDAYFTNRLLKNNPAWQSPKGKKKGNLVVMIYALKERSIGIYYGHDWKSSIEPNRIRILTDLVAPKTSRHKYADGFVAGLEETARVIQEYFHPTASRTIVHASQTKPTDFSGLWSVLKWVLVLGALGFGLVFGLGIYRRKRLSWEKAISERNKAVLNHSEIQERIRGMESLALSCVEELSVRFFELKDEIEILPASYPDFPDLNKFSWRRSAEYYQAAEQSFRRFSEDISEYSKKLKRISEEINAYLDNPEAFEEKRGPEEKLSESAEADQEKEETDRKISKKILSAGMAVEEAGDYVKSGEIADEEKAEELLGQAKKYLAKAMEESEKKSPSYSTIANFCEDAESYARRVLGMRRIHRGETGNHGGPAVIRHEYGTISDPDPIVVVREGYGYGYGHPKSKGDYSEDYRLCEEAVDSDREARGGGSIKETVEAEESGGGGSIQESVAEKDESDDSGGGSIQETSADNDSGGGGSVQEADADDNGGGGSVTESSCETSGD